METKKRQDESRVIIAKEQNSLHLQYLEANKLIGEASELLCGIMTVNEKMEMDTVM